MFLTFALFHVRGIVITVLVVSSPVQCVGLQREGSPPSVVVFVFLSPSLRGLCMRMGGTTIVVSGILLNTVMSVVI